MPHARILALVLITAAAGLNEASAQDGTNGAVVFKRCSICHSTVPGTGATIGPNLSGILGRKAGSLTGFPYSKAMADAGFDWDATKLDAFIAKPQSVVRGTRMTFMGLSDAKERADLIAYLSTIR